MDNLTRHFVPGWYESSRWDGWDGWDGCDGWDVDGDGDGDGDGDAGTLTVGTVGTALIQPHPDIHFVAPTGHLIKARHKVPGHIIHPNPAS